VHGTLSAAKAAKAKRKKRRRQKRRACKQGGLQALKKKAAVDAELGAALDELHFSDRNARRVMKYFSSSLPEAAADVDPQPVGFQARPHALCLGATHK
jgi:hypothetical protein